MHNVTASTPRDGRQPLSAATSYPSRLRPGYGWAAFFDTICAALVIGALLSGAMFCWQQARSNDAYYLEASNAR